VKRHETDLVSLIAGLFFLAIGTIYFVIPRFDAHLDRLWLWPVVLVGVGVAGLAGTVGATVRGARASRRTAPESPDNGDEG
jgi:O-antigen/teichoic acid export membrane protein